MRRMCEILEPACNVGLVVVGALIAGALFSPQPCRAAVDWVYTMETLTTGLNDGVFSTSNLGALVAVFALFVGVWVLVRLGRRVAK